MKPFNLYTLLLALSVAAMGEENLLLSPEKRALLSEERHRYEAEHEKLRYNWISPLNLKGTYGTDKNAAGSRSDTARAEASLSQDVFRSGGITYQIRYADAVKTASAIDWDRQAAQLGGELFDALLAYRKSRLELDQSETKLSNHTIEIFIKRQLYEAGKSDITELNNALMDQSAEQKNLAALRFALAEQRYEIAKLSDLDPERFELPTFELLSEEDYTHQRFDIRYAQARSQSLEHLYRVTAAAYLPSIALNASGGYQKVDNRAAAEYEGSFYGAGVALTLPLAYNASATIEETRRAYLKQAAEAADAQREAKASYAQSLERIESYRRMIAIAAANLSLYDELIAAVAAGVKAGSKTGYDLQTLRNTREIEAKTMAIHEISLQRELARLHFSTRKENP